MDSCCNTDPIVHNSVTQDILKIPPKNSGRCWSERTRQYAYYLPDVSSKYPFKYLEISGNVTFLGQDTVESFLYIPIVYQFLFTIAKL